MSKLTTLIFTQCLTTNLHSSALVGFTSFPSGRYNNQLWYFLPPPSACWFGLSWSTFLDEKLTMINHFYEYASTGQKTIKSHLCALSMISTQSSPTFTFDFLRWHANRRVNQTFIWRGFFLDLLQVCISIFSNFIPIWFWHLYEVPLSHGAQEKEPKVRSVHKVERTEGASA